MAFDLGFGAECFNYYDTDPCSDQYQVFSVRFFLFPQEFKPAISVCFSGELQEDGVWHLVGDGS